MRALVFGDRGPPAPGPDAGQLAKLPRPKRHLAQTPVALRELDTPLLPADDWVLLRTRLCGICGSDAKQVLLEGDADNAMSAVISFPQVLGHEVVADVVDAGPAARTPLGTRVVLNPWLSCAPRGIAPLCPACAAGDLSLCHHFTDGHLEPGIHTGTSATATGGFAELLPAHDSMCIPVPAELSDEAAVLADPFAVSLHAVLRTPPPLDGVALVHGIGALGTTTLEVLRALYPGVRVLAVAEHPYQADLARRFGAEPLPHEPVARIVEEVAQRTGAVTRTPFQGAPWLHPGGVDVVYDTVGSPATIEAGVRVTRARGHIVITGVADPGRFEWTPWYFKELRLHGSNAFGVEELEGVRSHAIEHYLRLAAQGRVDLTGMLTHTFPLEDWRAAFTTLIDRRETEATKVAFDLRTPTG